MSLLKYTVLPGCPIEAPIKEPHYAGDVGYDLGVAIRDETITIGPNSFDDVRTYVCVELPAGMWGDVRARSSTFMKRRLLVMSGTIDNGYRGELSVFLYNPNPYPVQIHRGDYLAQLVLMPILTPGLAMWESLTPTHRGDKGFGSSGGYTEMKLAAGSVYCHCGWDRSGTCPLGAKVGNHSVGSVLRFVGDAYIMEDRNGHKIVDTYPNDPDQTF